MHIAIAHPQATLQTGSGDVCEPGMTSSRSSKHEMTLRPRRVLFVELIGGIGDLVIALPAIQALSRSYPAAELTVLAYGPGTTLLDHDPHVAKAITVDESTGERAARLAADDVLQHGDFDLIVSDANYDGIDEAVARSGAARVVTNLWRQPPPDERTSERFLRLLAADGVISPEMIAPPQIYLTDEERRRARDRIGDRPRPYIFLCPDSGKRVKCWPPTSFAWVGRQLARQRGGTLIVPASDNLEAAESIVTSIGDAAVVWPRGPLRDMTSALSHADLVVAADTGLAHIAAALQVPVIVLFGPTSPARYGQSAPNINLQGYPACRERSPINYTTQRCWQNDCCPYGVWPSCLVTIPPEDVVASALSLLDTT
ncbi:MAG TPA: glycosyltransferase family 9 protein [Thermomicrobiales bacterium]|nr:glycosyltransferase family 9 protein [Thermomicrobiales bacterium]